LCVLAVALEAPAQGAKKFTSLNDLESSFEEATDAAMLKVNKDKLAALEAFLADKTGKEEGDLKKAAAIAGQLRVMVAVKTATNAAALKEAHGKYFSALDSEEFRPAVDVTNQVAEKLVDLDDVASAKAVWGSLKEKFGNHAQVGGQIVGLVDRELGELESIGSDPKAFSVKDLEGKDLSLEAYKGKVVLLDFWATWCGPCVQELPNVIAAYKKYHSKGFEIVGISLDGEDKSALTKFLSSHPDMKWQQFYDGKKWKNEVSQLYGVQSIPATYLIDQNGKIYRTGLRGKALERAVDRLLAKGAKKG
jgi:thiol-disulfide isomerase/thioredoxin